MGRLTYVTFTWQCWADSGLDFTGEPGEAVQGRRTGGAARPHSTGKMTWADGQEERVGCWIIRRLALSAPPTRLMLLLLNLSSSRSMCDVTDMFWNDLESHGHRRCWNLDSSHIGIFPQSFPDLLKTLRASSLESSCLASEHEWAQHWAGAAATTLGKLFISYNLQLCFSSWVSKIFLKEFCELGEREYRLSCHNSATISCQKLIKQNQNAEVKTGSLTQEEGISSTNFTLATWYAFFKLVTTSFLTSLWSWWRQRRWHHR